MTASEDIISLEYPYYWDEKSSSTLQEYLTKVSSFTRCIRGKHDLFTRYLFAVQALYGAK